jgi:recombination protein RecR
LAISLATNYKSTAGLIEKDLGAIQEIRNCKQCRNLSMGEFCTVCQDKVREKQTILVVESATDLLQIESAGVYWGYYFVLGHLISPINGVGPADLHLPELKELIAKLDSSEIIMGISSTVEGEATALYLRNWVAENVPSINLTQLARGLPAGVSVEYLDPNTLKGALSGRVAV